jgi:hypothetical protein
MIALAVTLVVLVFARDVARSAHGAITTQRSENRSFAGLANALITEENNFDLRLARLLGSGSTFSRPVFDARLNQLDQQMTYWSTAADLLRRPKLAHDVNDKIADLTDTRIDDYEVILATIARSLTLPAPSPSPGSETVADPAQSLEASALTWNRDRFALRHEPGQVHLDGLKTSSAKLFAHSGVASLTASSSLAVVRGIGIAAVSIVPAPLPATRGVLLLPPVTQMKIGVSVVNTGFVEQVLAMQVILQPSNGPVPVQRRTFHVDLAPLQSYAFVHQYFNVVPNERAVLTIRIAGAPASTNLSRSKTYRVHISPPGALPPG